MDRLPRRWHLMNGEVLAKQHPKTFDIPERSERLGLKPGDFAKLGFEFDNSAEEEYHGERIWVVVARVDTAGGQVRYFGTIDNDPVVFVRELVVGQTIEFGPEQVLNSMTPAEMAELARQRRQGGA
jgi:hypothetical protein